MRIRVATMGLTMVVGMLLVMQAGCSKKSIQSGGDAQSSERGMAKSGAPAQSQAQLPPPSGLDAPSATFPDLSLSSKPEDPETGGLRGFDSVSGGKAPSEERLGEAAPCWPRSSPRKHGAPDRGDSSRQAKEQAASAEAGVARCVLRLATAGRSRKKAGSR